MFMSDDKIILRAIEPEDLDTLYVIENDEQLWDRGVTNVHYSRYILHNYIAESKGDIYADRQVRLMVENAEGETVGIIDLVDFDPSHLRAEIGIVIQRKFRHKGYAYEALRKMLSYASRILHLHQLYVYIDSDNDISLKLFQKVGFCRTVCLKDWLYDGKSYHDAILMQYFL